MLLRWTCRVRVHGNDPREAIARGEKHVFSVLHAHQVAIALNAIPGTAAMVSRSLDGEALQPMFRLLQIVPMRGSNRRGGAEALAKMVAHVNAGRGPALIAVDGPRGPRGQVRKGIASLSQQTGATIINVVLVPRWRIVFGQAWDRFQFPIPFSRIDAYVAEPIRPAAGESIEQLRRRVEACLHDLEQRYDPAEAAPPPGYQMPMAA